jgi:hypothetical protein
MSGEAFDQAFPGMFVSERIEGDTIYTDVSWPPRPPVKMHIELLDEGGFRFINPLTKADE